MSEIKVSVNDETIELTGKEAEDFEKDRIQQHTDFIAAETEKAAKKLAAEAKLAALGLNADDLKALGL